MCEVIAKWQALELTKVYSQLQGCFHAEWQEGLTLAHVYLFVRSG